MSMHWVEHCYCRKWNAQIPRQWRQYKDLNRTEFCPLLHCHGDPGLRGISEPCFRKGGRVTWNIQSWDPIEVAYSPSHRAPWSLLHKEKLEKQTRRRERVKLVHLSLQPGAPTSRFPDRGGAHWQEKLLQLWGFSHGNGEDLLPPNGLERGIPLKKFSTHLLQLGCSLLYCKPVYGISSTYSVIKGVCQFIQELQITGWAMMFQVNPKHFTLHRLEATTEMWGHRR